METKFEQSSNHAKTEILEHFITIKNSQLFMPSKTIAVFMFMVEHKLRYPQDKGPCRELITEALLRGGFSHFSDCTLTKSTTSPCMILQSYGLISRKEGLYKGSFKVVDNYLEILTKLGEVSFPDKDKELNAFKCTVDFNTLTKKLLEDFKNNNTKTHCNIYDPRFFEFQKPNSFSSPKLDFAELVLRSEKSEIIKQGEVLKTREQEIVYLKRIIEEQQKQIRELKDQLISQNNAVDVLSNLANTTPGDQTSSIHKRMRSQY